MAREMSPHQRDLNSQTLKYFPRLNKLWMILKCWMTQIWKLSEIFSCQYNNGFRRRLSDFQCSTGLFGLAFKWNFSLDQIGGKSLLCGLKKLRV
jgi:hypothetical protein